MLSLLRTVAAPRRNRVAARGVRDDPHAPVSYHNRSVRRDRRGAGLGPTSEEPHPSSGFCWSPSVPSEKAVPTTDRQRALKAHRTPRPSSRNAPPKLGGGSGSWCATAGAGLASSRRCWPIMRWMREAVCIPGAAAAADLSRCGNGLYLDSRPGPLSTTDGNHRALAHPTSQCSTNKGSGEKAHLAVKRSGRLTTACRLLHLP